MNDKIIATIHIKSSPNNTIITLSSANDKVLRCVSAGALGFKGARRSTSYAAQLVAERVLATSLELGIRNINLRISGFGEGRESAIRVFSGKRIYVHSIRDVTPLAHGGCRSPKRRKI